MSYKIYSVTELKKLCGSSKSSKVFLSEEEWLQYCSEHNCLVSLKVNSLSRSIRKRYADLMEKIVRAELSKNPEMSWTQLQSSAGTAKLAVMLQDFGAVNSLFTESGSQKWTITGQVTGRPSKITIEEVWEAACIGLSYTGSLGAFKDFIAHKYGSFAEYCAIKGYDVNGFKWQNKDTAIRVARALGSLGAVQQRASGLHTFLKSKNLLIEIFSEP